MATHPRRAEKHRRSRVAAVAVACVLGAPACGDFSNTNLESLFSGTDAAAPGGTGSAAGGGQALEPLATLQVAPAPSLALARFQTPFALQLGVVEGPAGAADVCWEVADGALLAGLVLDGDSGLLFGKAAAADGEETVVTVRAYSPCLGPRTAEGSVTLSLVAPGACGGSATCAADEACAPDGACRIDLATACPAPVGPGVVAELEGAPAGLVSLERATVTAHGFSSDPSAPQRVLRLRSGTQEHVLRYELPGGLELPVAAGDVIDLRVQSGPGDGRYLMVRTDDTEASFQLAAHAGPIDGAHLWGSICAGLKHCPYLLGTDVALTAGCKGGTGCSGTPFGLRIKSVGDPVLPGGQAPWQWSNDGLPLYSALLADAATFDGCGEAVPDTLTYLLLGGSRPHPVIEYVDPDVVLGAVPRQVTLSGARSMPSTPVGTIDKWLWSVAMPSGAPAPTIGDGPALTIPVYLVGDVDVRLAVQEGKPPSTSPPEAGKRLHVRPGNGLHVELVWDDPSVDLDVQVAPAGAESLSERSAPSWAQGATVVAQPQGAALEVIRVPTSALGASPVRVWVAASPSRSVPTARLRVWLNGELVVSESELSPDASGAAPVAVVTLP